VICLVLLAQILDFSTAYLSYLVHPALFLQYEANNWARAAFYYGEWWKACIPWVLYNFLILVAVVSFKCLKKEITLNFFLISFAGLSTIGASTNAYGIICNDALDAILISPLMHFLPWILLAIGLCTQYLIDKEKKGQKLSLQGAPIFKN
jgi:hypothetical protein